MTIENGDISQINFCVNPFSLRRAMNSSTTENWNLGSIHFDPEHIGYILVPLKDIEKAKEEILIIEKLSGLDESIIKPIEQS